MTYKRYHEEYMKNIKGTSALETFLLIFPSFLEIFLTTIVFSIIANKCKLSLNPWYQHLHFLIDYAIMVFPITLRITILGKFSAIVSQLLLVVTFIVIYYIVTKMSIQNKDDYNITGGRRHFITNSRTTISIITAVAILAVDFKIFPRQYAKTEDFGYSLMDVGVGLFVFANGIVAPEIRKRPKGFMKSLSSTIPLLLLGSARFFVTKEIDYQVQVSEYGVHWNFFITLAVTKILSSLILTYVSVNYSLFISIILLTFHEIGLQLGLSNWVLSDLERDSFITSNREGIVSSLGYVGLYFLSVYFGKNLTISRKSKSDTRIIVNLFISSIVMLTLTVNLEIMFGTSRKLANSAYCSWIMFIGLIMTWLFIISENFLKYLYRNFVFSNEIYIPIISQAVNYNQLTFFILANILTGIVNIMMQTLYVGPFLSLVVINAYMFTVCAITHLFYVKNIKIKYW